MKEALLLMVLLSARTCRVSSQPYAVDYGGHCRNPSTEYKNEDSDLCCKKCPPGQRLVQMCNETHDSVCQPCELGLFIETWNYARNCFPCNKCKAAKGLLYAQQCSLTTRSRCMCKPGMYCIMESDNQHCTECRKSTLCKPGYGVSVPGTANSDVRCERCPGGTFSAALSSTDRCQPHTLCYGKAVVRKGNATADTECEDEVVSPTSFQDTTKGHHTHIVFTTASAIISTVSTTTESSPTASDTVLKEVFNSSTKSPLPHKAPGITLAITAGVIGFILLLIIIIIILAYRFKADSKKDAARFQPKLDTNGNCATGNKIPEGNMEETQLISFTVTSAEQQSLLDKAGACSDYSQSSNNTETLTRTDGGSSSHESIGALQSTVDMNNSNPALSEPMTLISNNAAATPQPASPLPSSPQIISPVTSNPQFNVNITFHIGNGSCGTTPSVVPMHSTQSDSHLPFGEEEESFSIPRQEDGKETLTSVQDTAVYEETPP